MPQLAQGTAVVIRPAGHAPIAWGDYGAMTRWARAVDRGRADPSRPPRPGTPTIIDEDQTLRSGQYRWPRYFPYYLGTPGLMLYCLLVSFGWFGAMPKLTAFWIALPTFVITTLALTIATLLASRRPRADYPSQSPQRSEGRSRSRDLQ